MAAQDKNYSLKIRVFTYRNAAGLTKLPGAKKVADF
jgi:hypothetical protein